MRNLVLWINCHVRRSDDTFKSVLFTTKQLDMAIIFETGCLRLVYRELVYKVYFPISLGDVSMKWDHNEKVGLHVYNNVECVTQAKQSTALYSPAGFRDYTHHSLEAIRLYQSQPFLTHQGLETRIASRAWL